MNIIAMIALAVVALVLAVLIFWVVISAIIYIYEEMIHNIRNLKREIKQTWWDLEWKFGKRG
jgi:hypothetical protein